MNKFKVGDEVLYHDGGMFIHAHVTKVYNKYECEDVVVSLKDPLYEIEWNDNTSGAMASESELSKVL